MLSLDGEESQEGAVTRAASVLGVIIVFVVYACTWIKTSQTEIEAAKRRFQHISVIK